ncbi:MAG: FAD-dependent oxidoreductase, partial [Verrucomicrobiia bacterium]
EKNVRLFLNTHVIRAEKQGDHIAAVIGKSIISSRETKFRGRIFADCTGDGTLGFLAGADFRVGREAKSETGESRAPEKADQQVMGTSVQWYAEEEQQASPFPDCPWAVQFNNETCQKLTKGDWDWETGMNLDQVTEIERIRDHALRVTFGNWAFLKNHSDMKAKVAKHRLAWVACIGGKRESRRLLGDVILQEQDVVGQRPFPDACVTTTWSIDLHYPHPENTRLFPGEEFRSIARHTKIKPYPIPFRCLYSRNVQNLMMAGRDISVTHVALGTVRVKRTTGMMGEVLGMAAALCTQHSTSPRGVYEQHLEELKTMMTRGVGRQQSGETSSFHFIQQAGNANTEEERLALLKQARQLPNLDARLSDDLDKLIAEVDSYARDKKLDYFARSFKKSLDYDFGVASDSPLQPIVAFYRGRMLTWITLESGGFWNNQQQRRALLDKARHSFEQAAKAFPQNHIAAMYLGKPFPAPKRYAAPANAPAWAVHQREAIERLADIIEWWIDHRTQPDGQCGGGWGDDCEMWRWWVPVLIGFDGPKITQAQTRFSKALLSLPHMQKGYSSILTDVEHSAEDLADTLTPMMHLDPDNPSWRAHALRLAELMETLWTGRNERGLLQFKSTYFAADRVDAKPQRACDTVYHPRAVQPALLYWQRTGDARLTKLFSAWMDTWVDAAARAERGKPTGIIPTAIHWPDGGIGGLGPDWWDPQNHSEHTLYSFPSAMSQMTHTLLLTWRMTGNDRYLAPIRSMAAARLKHLRSPAKEAAAGGEAWCASRISLPSVLAKYKHLTSSAEFDPLLAAEGNDLAASLRQTAGALAINFDGYTSEVRYTDRVLRFPTLFGKNGMFEKPIPSFQKPDTELLYRTVTGDPGDALYFPLNAVRWLTPPRDLAALVTASGADRFTAELFHFGKSPRAMSAELYLLRPGEYNFELVAPGNAKPLTSGKLVVKGPQTRIGFELPAQTPCQLSVHRPAR